MSSSRERMTLRLVRELAHRSKRSRPPQPPLPEELIEPIEESGRYDEICWELTASQTLATAGLSAYSKRHLIRRERTGPSPRPICGVQPGYTVGNFGPSDSGRCRRCYRAAARELGLLT